MSSTDSAPIATSIATPRPVAVSELKRAWSAVQAGEFHLARGRKVEPTPLRQGDEHHRANPTSPPRPTEPLFETAAHQRWVPAPGERVLPVLGTAGSVGCSTVALALAIAAADGPSVLRSRVVECCSASASGLAAASTAELGHHDSGWVRGTRGGVLLERASRVLVCVGQVPEPAPMLDEVRSAVDARSDRAESLTVVDTGWEVGHLVAGDGWLAELVRQAPLVVIVARPTIPGFRRLEAALELLEADHRIGTEVAVLGGRRHRWGKGIERSAGPRTRSALREGRLHEIPEDRHLAVAGLSSTPLPHGLVAAAEHLLSATLDTPPAPLMIGHVTDVLVGATTNPQAHATSPGHTSPQPPGREASTSTTRFHFDAAPQLETGSNLEGTAR